MDNYLLDSMILGYSVNTVMHVKVCDNYVACVTSMIIIIMVYNYVVLVVYTEE